MLGATNFTHGDVLRWRRVGGLVLAEVEYGARQRIHRHVHAHARFVLVLQGSLTEIRGNETSTYGPSTLLFRRPDEPHAYLVSNAGAICLIVDVDPAWLDRAREHAPVLAQSTVFVVAGAAYINRANLTPLIPPNTGAFGQFGWSGILRGAGVMFFAYIGFDAVSTAAQEAKNPSRDMPIGILASLAICTVIYILVAIVLLGIVPYQQLNVADPLAVGIDATGLRWLSPVIKVAALFGLFSTMLVNLLAQTRIFFSMSRDGLLPPIFSAVHPRFRTPHISTMMTATIIALVAGLTPIGVLSQLVSIGTLLAFMLVCIGVIILRRTAPDVPRPFRTPTVPLVASLVQ